MTYYYACIQGYDECMADYHACKAEEDACLEECYKLQGYKDCHVACVALREPCCKECCANDASCVSKCMKDKGGCGKTCRIYRPDRCGIRCAKDFCQDCLDKRAECEEIKAGCDNMPDCDTIKEDCDSQRTACLDGCANVFDECRTEYETRCKAQCLRKVKKTDPDDPDYIDIGDDILLFVFSGDIRSPLDR